MFSNSFPQSTIYDVYSTIRCRQKKKMGREYFIYPEKVPPADRILYCFAQSLYIIISIRHVARRFRFTRWPIQL